MHARTALIFLVLAVTVGSLESQKASETIQVGCGDPNDRCVPVQHCPGDYKRLISGQTDPLFLEQVRRRRCKPVVRRKKAVHICCPREDIECNVKGQPGACLLRNHCSTLQSFTEQQLLENEKENLCFVHDQKNYFCCTHPLCARHKKLCDQQSPEVPQITTIYQKCTGDKDTTGLLVPEVLCDERARSGTGGEDTRVCCIPPKTDRLISHPNAAKLAKIPCGTIGLMVKIQDGTYAQRGEFPWMVYLVYKYKRTCSGTLIHPSYVLTAHHCVQPGLEKVRLGEYNLEEKSQCSPGEAAGEACSHVQEIAISQKFRNHAHDVGLLRLAQPASLDGDLVRPICLPLYLNLRLHVPSTVSITGWGLTEKGKPSNILMKAETQVVTKEKGCTNDYVICVGGHNNSNHCNGDSGGPYQAQGTFGGFNRFVQYGIISDGSRYCATPDRPSRAVLVAYVMEWILSKMVL